MENNHENVELLQTTCEDFLLKLFSKLSSQGLKRKDIETPLESFGVDSIMVAQFNAQIEETIPNMPKSTLFQHRTISRLAKHLCKKYPEELKEHLLNDEQKIAANKIKNKPEVDESKVEDNKSNTPSEVMTTSLSGWRRLTSIKRRINNESLNSFEEQETDDVAVIGLYGRYPEADNLHDLWQMIKKGEHAISEVPEERWDVEKFYDSELSAAKSGKTYCRWGGFLKDAKAFDADFFNITPREAEFMDPQERISLEAAWATLEDSGYTPGRLREIYDEEAGFPIGVFMGVTSQTYQLIGSVEMEKGNNVYPLSMAWMPPNRVSHWYNFCGPSMPVDTACSSSLTAIHIACESLRKKECEMAMVGGVNLYLHPYKYLYLSLQRMLSPTGRCHTFSDKADGFVPGEGIGMMMLKSLSAAERDGDKIYARIKGTAINHSATTNGFMVPDPESQSALIRDAISAARVPAESISYIETHGTGTRLGDPIEIDGLINAFDGITDFRCALGTVKTNIGHLESAAGIAGIARVIMQMRAGKLAPSHPQGPLNSNIPFGDIPFYLVQGIQDWERPEINGHAVPRRAGVSSFGAGGANAHVIIEEYRETNKQVSSVEQELPLFLFSAKDDVALKNILQDNYNYLSNGEIEHPDIHTYANSLQNDREQLSHRIAIHAQNFEELSDTIKLYLEGDSSSDNLFGAQSNQLNPNDINSVFTGQNGEAFLDTLREQKDYERIAKLWVTGVDVNWRKALDDSPELSKGYLLPTYSFKRETYWVETAPQISGQTSEINTPAYKSVEQEQNDGKNWIVWHKPEDGLSRYRFMIDRQSPIVQDHKIHQAPVFPAVACLEVVREAAIKAKELPEAYPLELRSVELSIPIQIKASSAELNVEFLDKGAFRISSKGMKEDDLYVEHVKGAVSYLTEDAMNEDSQVVLAQVKKIMSDYKRYQHGSLLYNKFNELGIEYGASFQAIDKVWVRDNSVLAYLRLQDHENVYEDTVLNPGIVDGALQSVVLLTSLFDEKDNTSVFIPFSVDSIKIFSAVTPEAYALIDKEEGNSRINKYNIRVVSKEGKRLVDISGLYFREYAINKKHVEVTSKKHELFYYADNQSWRNIEIKQADETVENEFSNYHAYILDDSEKRSKQTCSQWHEKFSDNENFYELITAKSLDVDSSDTADYEARFHKMDWVAALDDSKGFLLIDYLALNDALETVTNFNNTLKRTIYFYSCLIRSLLKKHIKHIKIVHVSLHEHNSSLANIINQALSGFARSVNKENVNVEIISVLVANAELRDLDYKELINLMSNKQLNQGVFKLTNKGYVQNLNLQSITELKHGEITSWVGEGKTYLVTGGLGGIAVQFAQLLKETAQVKLVLSGRSPLSEAGEKTLALLSQSGSEAIYIQADISKPEEVDKLIKESLSRFGTINGVFHSAGVLRDNVVIKQNPAAISNVIGPKVHGTYYLDKYLANCELDWFVLCSSLAGIVGNIGQADYAFANRFMDNFAIDRQRRVKNGECYGRTVSIAWPLWKDGGMSLPQELLKELERLQISPIDFSDAKDIFVNSLENEYACIVPIKGDKHAIDSLLSSHAWFSSVLAKKQLVPQKKSVNNIQQESSMKTESIDLKAVINTYLKEKLIKVSKLPPEKINDDVRFEHLGIDSVMVMELNGEFEKDFQDIPKTILFEYTSLSELATYFLENHTADLNNIALSQGMTLQESEGTIPEEVVVENEHTEFIEFSGIYDDYKPEDNKGVVNRNDNGLNPDDIAIVGFAGRYPKADDMESFWNNLQEGRDCITEIPKDRWDINDYYDPDTSKTGTIYSKWGGFLSDVKHFDPLFFGISPRDAKRMDPQERLFMEASWRAIEHAGYTPESLGYDSDENRYGDVGVIAGVMYGEYQFFGANSIDSSQLQLTNSSYASVANRTSYAFNFTGPSFTVDSMCSSSLTTIHLASAALRNGDCNAVIAGGVNVSIHPYKYLTLSALNFASTDGRCRSFGEGGDGYVPGEGVGVVLLKRLSDAERDGDYIHAVIRGSSVNHGGRTSGYTVPNPNAQRGLIKRAFKNARITAQEIDYIEAHGTGTDLGDPIEIRALTNAFNDTGERVEACPIGSVKSNVGHLESAAGIAGLTKIILQMQNQMLVPSLHAEESNPNIDFQKSFFKVQKVASSWQRRVKDSKTQPYVAALSAFGAGGANAHLVVQEYQATDKRQRNDVQEQNVFLFSAADSNSLKKELQQFASYLSSDKTFDNPLHDIAYTLRHGRRSYDYRLAIIAQNVIELSEGIKQALSSIEDWAEGSTANTRVISVGKRLYDSLVQNDVMSWVSGKPVDWLTHEDAKRLPTGKRTPLPGKILNKRLCWIDEKAEKVPSVKVVNMPTQTESYELTPQLIFDAVKAGKISREEGLNKLKNLKDELKENVDKTTSNVA